MKRIAALVLFALALMLTASNVQAVDGRPSDAALADMGLAGMQVMSDAEAMTVRGEGITVITGKHSKVIKFNFAYASPGGHVSAKGFAWAIAY